jgi:putative DNA primase/helicase
VAHFFDGGPQNIGVLLGEPHGVADLDLDCDAAIEVAALLAPATGMIFGRASKPASHRFYRCDPARRSKKYLDPTDKTCLVELRCLKSDGTVGLQTVVPPSVHKQGEDIRFEPGFDREPAKIDPDELGTAVAHIAAAALLARHWPQQPGGRHDAFLALAGVLYRGRRSIDDTIAFHFAIYRGLWGGAADLERCAAEVRSTFEKAAAGGETTGFPKLAEAVGDVVAKTATKWILIQSLPPGPSVASIRVDLMALPFNDYGNGQRLIAAHGDRIRYSHEFNAWLVFDGRRWEIDRRDCARVLVQQGTLDFTKRALKTGNELATKFAASCLNSQRLTAALREARPHLNIETTALDANPDLLNFLNGTDLKSGTLRVHRREDCITKMVRHQFRPEVSRRTRINNAVQFPDCRVTYRSHGRGGKL